ncbi:MAG TPA: carboxypeptidase-like regulatory domain-containing protein [Oligoflexus sp.]|uniref:carboxypeptidase-like regulatory domain-containing protein n=1 Tax=Oligoflexus sp. TaxID=1971216 RepID=UPI002D63F38C|nr:carboxypeptidase-like regulatory domain-containing protein [Oligoflexus sp.]HYX34730.1 carboxypeptidase-like regulatory domain-containing protein [Oligoflexus sp.]
MRSMPGTFLCLLLLMSCGGNTTQRNTIVNSADATQKGIIVGQLQIDDGAPATTVAGATVTVQDHPELVTKTKSDGSFQIESAPAGTLNVLVTSASGTGLAAAEYGVKIDEIKVKPLETTDLGEQKLKKTGRLTGLITFFDNPNNLELAGSDVYVPGTDFIAKTDSQGSFLLEGLPEGTYTLKMQHTGFATTTLEVITVTSNQLTDLGSVPLSLALGPEGGISLQHDLTTAIGGKDRKIRTSRTVEVSLNYDGDAALMKVSADPTFLNTTWKPVEKKISWTFDSDGEKNLYVTFADLNGLESSPFSDTVIVDTEVPLISEVKIMEGWAQTATSAVYLDVTGTDTGAGIQQIMLSNDANFTGASWQSFSSRTSWAVSSGNGSKTVYAKIKDYAGYESTVSSDAINKGAYTLIHNTTYASKVTLYKEQSPYLITDDITFSSDVEIRSGVSLYIEADKTVTVKGVFTSKGTSTEEVLISRKDPVASSCNTFGITSFTMDLSKTLPGVSTSNVIQYTRFQLAGYLNFNGGTVTNNTFDSSLCTTEGIGSIAKYGLDNLVVSNNTFTEWKTALAVQTGIGNTTFSNNSGSIMAGFYQYGEATGTIIKNNTIQWTGTSHAIYAPGSGTFALENNSYTGTPYYGWYIYTTGNYTINNVDFTNALTPFKIGSSGSVTINGGTITSCTTLFSVENNPQITATNLTVSGCSRIIDQNYSTGQTTISSSNLTVSNQLVNVSASASPTTTFSNNTITCSTGSGKCDLYYKLPMDGDTDTLTMTNNTINCALANNCRGFTFNKGYSQDRAQNFNLTLSGNTFVGKALNSNLSANKFESTNDTQNDTEVKIFLFSSDGGSDITLGGTISQ